MIVNRKKQRGKVIGGAIVRRKGTVGQARERIGEEMIGRGVGVEAPPRRKHAPEYSGGLGRKWLYICAAVLVVTALVGGGAWLWQSPYFKVQQVEVAGTQRTDAEELVAKSGLLGTSMFEADLAAAQESLLALPLIKHVKIERAWPDTIKLTVEERQGWGTWEQAGIGYVIDREGVVLGTWEMPPGTPVIKGQATTTKRPGDHVDYQAVDAASEIYEQLPAKLGTEVTEVAFITGKGVQVTTADGQKALFGDSSSVAYKLAVWAAMAAQAKAEHINYTTVDLRFGNRPVLQ